ncbi:MAG TPA: hypothetical protein VJO34_15165 [Methylomirabilota bacterium]|nr:hypothetical protein [Methylomirabilota bacterium]
MRLIQTGSPMVGLSTDISVPEEPSGFVAVDVPVRIEPPPKHLPRLTLACSLGSEDTVHRVHEESKLVHQWLRFSIPREHCPEGGYLTLSADLDGTVLWQKSYRSTWKQSMPFLDELS